MSLLLFLQYFFLKFYFSKINGSHCRYLESCSAPDTVKNQSLPTSTGVSLDSDAHRKKADDNTKTSTGISGLHFLFFIAEKLRSR